MSEAVHLTIGISTTPLTRALLEGKVQPVGIELTCVGAYGKGPASAQVVAGTLDGGEFSMSSLLTATTRGIRLAVLPIFLGRDFVHRGFWCREGSGIETPSDYVGQRVAIHRYNNSYGVWARGVLLDEYGVPPKSIRWYAALDNLEGENSPEGIAIERVSGPVTQLVDLLEQGIVDGAVELYLFEPGPVIRRIFENYRQEDAAYFRRTNVFPMYHTIVLRPAIVEGRRWVAESILEAFRASRRLATSYMTEEEREEDEWKQSVLSYDPYEYRLGASERRSFEEMNRYMVREGLLDRPHDADTFFTLKE